MDNIIINDEGPQPSFQIGAITMAQGETEKTITVSSSNGSSVAKKVTSQKSHVSLLSTNVESIDADKLIIEEYNLDLPAPNDTKLREYCVVATCYSHLGSIYADMESEGAGIHSCCPQRVVECADRCEDQRYTYYLLNQTEAELLQQDPRIENVDLSHKHKPIGIKPLWTQSSSNFNKSALSTTNQMVNWGMLSMTNSELTPYGQDTQIPDTGTISLNSATGQISGTPAARWFNKDNGTLYQWVKVTVTDSSNPPVTASNISTLRAASWIPGHHTGIPRNTPIQIARQQSVNYSIWQSLGGGTPGYFVETLSYWRRTLAWQGGTSVGGTATNLFGIFNYEMDEEMWLTTQDSSSPIVTNPNTAKFRVTVTALPGDTTFSISPSYPNWRDPLDLGTVAKDSIGSYISSQFTISPVNGTFTEIFVSSYMMTPSGPYSGNDERLWSYSLDKSGNNYLLTLNANPDGYDPGTYYGVYIISGPGFSAWNANHVFKNIYVKFTISGTPNQISATPSNGVLNAGLPYELFSGDVELKFISGSPLTPVNAFSNVSGGVPPYTYKFYGDKGWGLAGQVLNTSGTVVTSNSGKNVDVVIFDEGDVQSAHPEYAVNSNGTGGSRVVDLDGPGGIDGNPVFAPHAFHVASTVAGNTQGWARNSTIRTVGYSAYTQKFSLIKNFHKNKAINPSTGVKNPTVVNNSWQTADIDCQLSYLDQAINRIASVTYRGITYQNPCLGIQRPYGLIGSTKTFSNSWAPYPMAGATLQGGLNTSGILANSTGGVFTGWAPTVLGHPGIDGLGLNSKPTSNIPNSSTTPTVGNNNDGYWEINLPWQIIIWDPSLINSFVRPPILTSKIWVSTNGYISFQQPASASTGKTLNDLPGVCLAFWNGDLSCQRIYYGEMSYTTGQNWDSAFTVRWEGHTAPTGGELGKPSLCWEVTFLKPKALYDPNLTDQHIAVTVIKNDLYRTGFTRNQLLNWGIPLNGNNLQINDVAADAAIQDCINEGVIMVAAAGNSNHMIAGPDDPDYNNRFTWLARGNISSRTVYYNRPPTPAAKSIVVGALGNNSQNQRASFSNFGTGVDVWAPGVAVMGAYTNQAYITNAVPDSRNASYYLNKLAGTSMASPQVTGLLALALETNPRMNQASALTYLRQTSKPTVYNIPLDQPDKQPNPYQDPTSLAGGDNLSAAYKLERPEIGVAVPKMDLSGRPTQGQSWPRPRIFRYGA